MYLGRIFVPFRFSGLWNRYFICKRYFSLLSVVVRTHRLVFSLMENLLSSNLLSKNLKIKIYRAIILLVVLYGCETWSLKLWEERGKYLGLRWTR
jgi:uncharacterized membrane protein YhfC